MSLAVTNAHVLTFDPSRPVARALVVHDGIITYVGSDDGARTEDRGVDVRLDARGRTVIPGFNDAHGHFLHEGLMRDRVDLSGARNVREVYARIRAFAAARRDLPVVVAERWDQSAWDDPALPSREGLDGVESTRPVLCRRVCGHIAYANRALLDLYDARWTGPADGIDRASGLLLEAPSLQFSEVVPPRPEDLDRAARAFVASAAREGVTSAQDFANVGYWRAWQRLAAARNRGGDDLGVRLDVSTYTEHLDAWAAAGLETGTGGDWLSVGGVKIFADGSLGGWSAHLSEPYHDRHGERGHRSFDDASLAALVRKAHGANLQVRMHVIGDAAVAQGTAAYETVASEAGIEAFRARRHRFEHYEMSDGPLRARAKRLGLVLSMQPNFVGAWSRADGLYGQRLGGRHVRTNPFRLIVDEGLPLAFGSDSMPFSPARGLRDVVGAPYPHMRLDLVRAIQAYTQGSAFAQHREHVKGTLRPGLLGDLAVLDRDLGALDGNDARSAAGLSVTHTVLDGRLRFGEP